MKVHISLNVNNVAASAGFYSKMLGVEPTKFIEGQKTNNKDSGDTKPRMGYAKFSISNPALNLTLNEVGFQKGGSLSHLGLQVETTDEVLEFRKRWTRAGLVTEDEMAVDCCYAKQDKTWVSDPDGNEWEAFVVLADTQDTQKEESCDISAGAAEKVEHGCCADTAQQNASL